MLIDTHLDRPISLYVILPIFNEEEIIEEKIPLIILDPHGEYHSMKHPNKDDKEKLESFGLVPKGYSNSIQEFSPDTEINSDCLPIKLSSKSFSSAAVSSRLMRTSSCYTEQYDDR